MNLELESDKRKKFPLNIQGIKNYSLMMGRLRRNLCYGNNNECDNETIDYPSMPLTEVTLQIFRKAGTDNNDLPTIDMNFASNLSKKSCLSPCSIVLAIIYFERLKQSNPEYLRRVSPCDLFVVSIMIASKFLFDDGEDEEVFNDEWATAVGIEVKHLNKLEREFLAALDWSCYVDDHTFIEHLILLEAKISLHQLSKRRNIEMTYSELLTVFDSICLISSDFWILIMEKLIQVLIVSAIVYYTAAFTLIASSSLIIPSQIIIMQSYNLAFSSYHYLKIIDNNSQLIMDNSQLIVDNQKIDLESINFDTNQNESVQNSTIKIYNLMSHCHGTKISLNTFGHILIKENDYTTYQTINKNFT